MITVNAAFLKFKGNLEILESEEADAIRRRDDICAQLSAELSIKSDFLTGSYRRETKTKPLKDVDIFAVMADSERFYLDRRSDDLLAVVAAVLEPIYGEQRFGLGRHSVQVDFGRRVVDDVADGVMSFDVVPAFENVGPRDGYWIPDAVTHEWIRTDPRIHARMATEANSAFGEKWKPAVKMIKKWNDHNAKPVKPSFLLEVMALELLDPPFESYPFDLRQFFSSAANSIDAVWPDPAGLGPAVSDRMNKDRALTAGARQALKGAEAACTQAMLLERTGRVGAALDAWQGLFGPLFVKS